MKIATFNVNSIRARLDVLERWLAQARPDVVCLLETKVEDHLFPADSFTRMGYEIARAGQKTYNGAALFSLLPLSDVRVGLLHASPEEDRRLLSARITPPEGPPLRIHSAYIPNGKSLDSPSFAEKLRWLARLRETVLAAAEDGMEQVVCGDFNIAPDERDVYDPEELRGQLHFSDAEHEALTQLLSLGLTDAFRLKEEGSGHFSWWDYRMAGFRRNRGLRIDHLFVTPGLVPRVRSCTIDKTPRGWEKPSDHTPVVLELGTPD